MRVEGCISVVGAIQSAGRAAAFAKYAEMALEDGLDSLSVLMNYEIFLFTTCSLVRCSQRARTCDELICGGSILLTGKEEGRSIRLTRCLPSESAAYFCCGGGPPIAPRCSATHKHGEWHPGLLTRQSTANKIRGDVRRRCPRPINPLICTGWLGDMPQYSCLFCLTARG